MDKKSTTFGMENEHLARLLGLGVEASPSGEASMHEIKADLLRASLRGTLPLDSGVVEALPALFGRLREEILPLEGKPLADVLLDERTELGLLDKVKEHWKGRSTAEASEAEHAVAISIYFGAIASALLFHDTKITSYSYPSLAESFKTMTEKRWMAPELARHFSKARNLCKKKTK